MSNGLAVHSLTTFDTDIVVDLGCCSYERAGKLEDSIVTLIKRFKPKILFGFDPHPALVEGIGQVYGTTVVTTRMAAWTSDGVLGLAVNGNCTHVAGGDPVAPTFDLANFVRTLPEVSIVLKMDVEGAEYVLLPHLIDAGQMVRFSRLLVEWHTGVYANGWEADQASILEGIPSEVEVWH